MLLPRGGQYGCAPSNLPLVIALVYGPGLVLGFTALTTALAGWPIGRRTYFVIRV